MLERMVGGNTSRMNNTGSQDTLKNRLSNMVLNIVTYFKLNADECELYYTGIDRYFDAYWRDLSPMVGSDIDNFMQQLCLSILGTTIPAFLTNGPDFDEGIYKADLMINALDASRNQRSNGHSGGRNSSNVGIARNVQQHHNRGGSAYSTSSGRRMESKKPSLVQRDEAEMYDKQHYTSGRTTLPHTSAPLKTAVGGTKPVAGATRILILPPVVDRLMEFEKDDHSNIDQLSHEPSVVSYQLGTISELVNGDKPSLYKWWVEEHMVYGTSVSHPEADERVTFIFNSFSTVNDYDTLIDLIRELGNLSKNEIVMWLSNRITDEILSFIQRNYDCADQLMCTSYLRKPVESLEELAVFGIKEQVVHQILATFRKLFKDWAFLVLHQVDPVIAGIAELNAEGGVGKGGDGDVMLTTVVLRYAKNILTLPIMALYYKYGNEELEINNKSLYVLSAKPCVKTDAIDALIQNVFGRFTDPDDHELLIVDKTLTLYRTFKLRDEPPTEVFYEIEKLTL